MWILMKSWLNVSEMNSLLKTQPAVMKNVHRKFKKNESQSDKICLIRRNSSMTVIWKQKRSRRQIKDQTKWNECELDDKELMHPVMCTHAITIGVFGFRCWLAWGEIYTSLHIKPSKICIDLKYLIFSSSCRASGHLSSIDNHSESHRAFIHQHSPPQLRTSGLWVAKEALFWFVLPEW